jgi:glutamyl-tRNA synthetase
LHVGNLRTGLLAWLVARSAGERFVVRMEDLDRTNASAAHEVGQLADLAAIGVDWDGPVVRQSERFALYEAAIAELGAAGLVYECYCTRREILEAAAAPHGPVGAYPGTCRDLPAAVRAARRAQRPPALRLRAAGESISFDDELAGTVTGAPDDVVLRRNDGVPAYNLAVVVDDAAQGVDVVVRGDDLLASTPRQIHLRRLLGLPDVRYVHVALVVGADGARLAKRHGAVTLHDLAADGVSADRVAAALRESLGLDDGPFDLARVAAVGPSPVALADLQRSWS